GLAGLGLHCCVVDDVLTAAECDAIVAAADGVGFEPALLGVKGGRQALDTTLRDSERCIADAPRLAAALFRRLRPHLPEEHGDLRIVGLNERLRVLRYTRGQFFRDHRDASYARPVGHADAGARSRVTVLIYLTNDFEGGRTTFFDARNAPHPLEPRRGRAVLHDHDVWHEAPAVDAGVKVVLRTDVMY
ncbi:hypothetical protein M885DRAFT_425221, partial [Pelagophyceae sp. CCMP2097]